MRRRAAARWLVRLQSERDPRTKDRFEAWVADPDNARAFERISESYRKAGLLRESPIVQGLPERPAEPARPQVRYALAAAIAAILLIPVAFLATRSGPFSETGAILYSTRPGEKREIALSDGSKLVLGGATQVEVEVGAKGRQAALRTGKARFRIAGGERRFVILAGPATVSAAEGVVDVERSGNGSNVDVIAGIARLQSGPGPDSPALELKAGERGTASPGSAPSRSQVGARPEAARAMLEFDGTPLPEAVALANRHSERPIRLVGDLQGLRVTGGFRAGDTQALARALAAAFSLRLQTPPDGTLLLSPAPLDGLKKKNGR